MNECKNFHIPSEDPTSKEKNNPRTVTIILNRHIYGDLLLTISGFIRVRGHSQINNDNVLLTPMVANKKRKRRNICFTSF